MSRLRKISLFAIVLFAAAFLLVFLRASRTDKYMEIPPKDVARVYFPDGTIREMPESGLSGNQWSGGFAPNARATLPFWQRAVLTVMESLRLQSYPVPNPPREVELLANVRTVAGWTSRTFYVHQDLLDQFARRTTARSTTNAPTSVKFTYGGDAGAKSAREWAAANLEGIRTNGASAYYGTNVSNIPCVIAVSRTGIYILPKTRLPEPAGGAEQFNQ